MLRAEALADADVDVEADAFLALVERRRDLVAIGRRAQMLSFTLLLTLSTWS